MLDLGWPHASSVRREIEDEIETVRKLVVGVRKTVVPLAVVVEEAATGLVAWAAVETELEAWC